MTKQSNKKAIVIVDGRYGDMFELHGKAYCLNTMVTINGKKIPAALITIDDDKASIT